MSINTIAHARKCGIMHFHCLHQYPVHRGEILEMCGLFPEPKALKQISRQQALMLLADLLRREPAYETELMEREVADALAEDFVQDFSDAASRFFTASEPLTGSVWDSGILIESGQGNDTRHVCLWFEDED